MTETPKQDAPAYDSRGNVRPTDARFTGADRAKVSAQELVDIRDAEIRRNTEIIAEQQRELQEQNDRRLREATEGVLPSSPTDAPADVDDVDTELKGAELEQALKDRGLPTTGTADEKRARVAEHDAQQGA